MNLLFVTPTYPPMPGGGERYAAALATHLRQRGHNVSVVTSAAREESQLWEGVTGATELGPDDQEIRRLPIRSFPGGRRGLLAYRKLMVLLSALPGNQSKLLSGLSRRVPWIDELDEALATTGTVDLIHAFNLSWESAAVAAWGLSRTKHLPLVVTPFAHFGSGANDRVARNSTMDHQLQLMREAAGVLVLTGTERQALAGCGVPTDHVVILGGSADPMPSGWEAALASLDNLLIPQHYALFVGRASRDKGAIDAAEAVLRLRRQQRDIALVLAGSDTPEFSSWLEHISPPDRLGILPLGIVSEDTKHALLSRAEMLLLPSRSDSFGIVLLEAWQHGKPVIGARAGGIPGVIDDGQDGLLVNYGNVSQLVSAIVRLLDDQPLAAALGAAGLRKVTTELTWEQTATRAEAAYRHILKRA